MMISNQVSEKDFKYIKQLGSGSFGTVHLAKNINTQKLFAIKSVQLSKMGQKEKDGALNEVRLLASINIHYVVGYHGAFFDNAKQTLCIVMEYCDGGDLQNMITNLKDTTEQGVEENYIWKVAYEIFNGLKILHKNKIIHRDIKSANIFFSNGIAKLGDLNVSKVAEQGMCQTQTGTPYYTSPQIWKGQQYTSKTDIWSTGCLLYQMCTLSPPFKGRDFPSLYRKVIVGDYEQIPQKYSYQLQEMIRMCLTVNDQMRPSAADLLETSVLSGMEDNMDRFGDNGEVNLIDAIKCPRVLRFLNTKLPKRIQKEKKKIVNFNEEQKQVQKTQGCGFKIQKQPNLRKIRSQKVISAQQHSQYQKSIVRMQDMPLNESQKNTLIKSSSKRLIKLPPLQQQKPAVTQNQPLNFTCKKTKSNTSYKRIQSTKQISINLRQTQQETQQYKTNAICLDKPSPASTIKSSRKVLLSPNPSVKNIDGSNSKIYIGSSSRIPSGKVIGSNKHITITHEKENKKLCL